MLAAAFGAMVGPAWCQWWAIFGAFGLTSAVGLDIRSRWADQTRRRQLALKAQRKLDEMIGDTESSGAILAALHQLQLGAADPTPQGSQLSERAEAAFQQAGDDNASAPIPQREPSNGWDSLWRAVCKMFRTRALAWPTMNDWSEGLSFWSLASQTASQFSLSQTCFGASSRRAAVTSAVEKSWRW